MDIQSAKQVIRAAALADDTVIMEGLHGIGKSNIVKQFSKEDGYHLEELFLSHQEVGDLIGIPHTIEKDNETITTWSKPIWLQRCEQASKAGKKCIIFLDELNRAPIDVRQSALQLVLERQIHEHILPSVQGERTLIVAAINPADEYQVDELDPALLDRFLHITVEADAQAWLSWARNSNVNQVVQDFISEYPDRIHYTPADQGIGATPRSWAKLGDFMDNVDSIPEEILFQVMKGKIGTELASQFYTFFKNYVDVVKMQDIIDIVQANSELPEIEMIASKIEDKIENVEAIQKTELAHQLSKQADELSFLAYLYALPIENCVAFLKGFRKDNAEDYKKLVSIDSELNNKKLFKRILDASYKD
jgi:alkaline phosphatase D